MKKAMYLMLGAVTILLVLSASVKTSPAADYSKIGVRIGDNAVYSSSYTGSEVSKTEILVYGIVGTQVYLNLTDYFPNGTVAGKIQYVADTQAGSAIEWLFLIASNLNANDPVYPGATYKINETKTMNIGGETRTVNHLNGTSSILPVDAYWDKTLGIMVKLNLWFIGWFNYTMISFTSPSAPSGALTTVTTIALAEGAVIVILLAYIVLSRRRGKRRN